MVVSAEAATQLQIANTEPGGRLRVPRSRREWLPEGPLAWVATGFALLLPLLVMRTAWAPGWTPKYAALGLEAAIGLPLTIALVRSPARRVAVAALGFAAVATISTLASDNPAMSFFGMEFWGTGLLFVVALVGMWALGVCVGPRGSRSIEHALLIAVAVNCVVVAIEVFIDLSRIGVLTVNGQPAGLLGQPVALGALLLGGFWLVGRRAAASTAPTWLFAVAAIVACIELAGERLPLVLIPVVIIVLWRHCSWRRVLLIGVSAILGLAVGGWAVGIGAATPSASGRIAADSGDAGRVENYVSAVHAIADRPVLGWGPGRYQAATSQYRTRALESAGPDVLYADAHNSIAQYGVTTGVVGLVFLGGWVLLAFRRAAGPLLGFAALVMIVQLLQPQDVSLTPLAFLALGAAGALATPPARVVPVAVHALAIAAGIVFAGVIVVGGYREWNAAGGSYSDAIAVAKMLPHWPDRTVLAGAAILSSDEGTATDRVAAAREWSLQGIARDARDVRMYRNAALFDVLTDDPALAREHAEEGVRLSPYSPIALTNLAQVQHQQGDDASARRSLQVALEIEPDYALAKQMLATLNG